MAFATRDSQRVGNAIRRPLDTIGCEWMRGVETLGMAMRFFWNAFAR